VFASQYAKLLPIQLVGQYLDAAIQVIESNHAGIPVKVSAVKAIHKYVFEMSSILSILDASFSFCVGADNDGLIPYMARIAKDLGPFMLVTSEDTLSLVLETLSVVIQVDSSSWLTPDLANSLTIAVLEVWAKNNKGEPPHNIIAFNLILSWFQTLFFFRY
jgi:importin-9